MCIRAGRRIRTTITNSPAIRKKANYEYRYYKTNGNGAIQLYMNTDITKQMEMVLYRTEDDNVTVSALIKDETIWITQKAMAELFGVQTPAISKHLKNIFEQGELHEEVVVSKMEIPTPHGAIPGKTQLSPTNYYNLDAIISVGYRVNSIQATKFRIWATGILKEYMIKGFAMDDERLKQGKTAFGKDYFRELLERVRSIRAYRTNSTMPLPVRLRLKSFIIRLTTPRKIWA